MPIVGGLDIHRKQLTFDYLDTVTGEVKRGQIAPADRVHLRAWLARFAGRDDVAFALEGCTGWRYVAEELAGPASRRTSPSRLIPLRPRPQAARQDRQDRLAASAGAAGRGPAAGVLDPAVVTSWSAGRCWRPTTTCGPSTPPGCSASTRCSSIRAPRRWATARCAPTTIWRAAGGRRRAPVPGRAAAGGHRAGHARRPGGPPGRAAAPAAGRCPEPDRGEGARRPAVRGRPGHRAGDDLLAGRGGPVLLLPQGGPVRRAGRHRLVLGPQGPARAAVPAGPAGAALFVGTRRVRVYRCRVSPAVTARGRSGCGAAVVSAFGCESGSRAWRTSRGWAGLAVSGRGAAAGRFAFSCADRHACSCGRRVGRGQSRSPGRRRCGLRAGA